MNPETRGRLRAAATTYSLSLLVWFLFALVIAGYYSSMQAPISQRMGFWGFLLLLYLSLMPFALLTPLTFKWCRALSTASRTPAQWLLKHLGVCAFWYVSANALTAPFGRAFWRPDDATIWDVLLQPMMNQILTSLISFWILAAAAMLTAAFEERQQRESAIARMRAQLTDAKLQNLRYKLNPHFLFNSINAAVGFVRTGRNDKAERMLLALAELMDAYLSPQTPLTMTLEEEMSLLHRYLEIETIRFGDKLCFEEDLAPGSERLAVPSMLLQPLLENAVRHGIARRTQPGLIRLRTRLDGATLTITIDNDVPDGAAEESDGHGLGLSLTRARLAETYGPRAALEAGPGPAGRYRVRLLLPITEPGA